MNSYESLYQNSCFLFSASTLYKYNANFLPPSFNIQNDWLRTFRHEGIMFGEINKTLMFSAFIDEPNFIHSKIKSNGNKNKEAGGYCGTK